MHQQESKRAAEEVTTPDTQLHKAPSMLWFIVPLGLLLVYAVLSR